MSSYAHACEKIRFNAQPPSLPSSTSLFKTFVEQRNKIGIQQVSPTDRKRQVHCVTTCCMHTGWLARIACLVLRVVVSYEVEFSRDRSLAASFMSQFNDYLLPQQCLPPIRLPLRLLLCPPQRARLHRRVAFDRSARLHLTSALWLRIDFMTQ